MVEVKNIRKAFGKRDEVPLYLFEKRDLNLLDQNSVCVVWSRKAFK